MRCVVLALTGLAISSMLSACTSSDPSAAGRRTPTHRSTPASTPTGPARAPAPAAASVLECAGAIGTQARPRRVTTVLGVVGLPVSPHTRALGTARTGNGHGPLRLFAKTGLVIRPGAQFELIVPARFAGRLSFGWGNPGRPSHRVRVNGCTHPGDRWLAYAGGYWIDHPACVPITVRVGDRRSTVHVGLGAACPGQQPPAQPSQS